MASEINPGVSVWIKMPFGAFRLQAEPGRETILIAGGTGITPFISFLQHACGQTSAETIRLFYGLRSMNLITHAETVRQSLRQLPAFTCQIFTEDGSGVGDANHALPGQLDINRILSPISNPASAIFFLSGPPAMVLRFRSELTNQKISPGNIKVDDWE
ncbi:MAG: FAD-dependent oxidoreductase [bacterium]